MRLQRQAEGELMKNDLITVTIYNRKCHIYKNQKKQNKKLPVFYWGVGEESQESIMTVVSYLRGHLPEAHFILAAYESQNWNDDFSPWVAEPVFGKDGFGGNAEHTLKWLNAYYIPYVEKKECEIARFSVGYSLAGLFSLWVYCACNAFSGMVSCSGSLWYEGVLDYVQKKTEVVLSPDTKYVYLSLGDKEEQTKNKKIAVVGDNTKRIYKRLCECQENMQGILEWNHGGHFSEPDIRIAKGIYWILKHFDV